MRAKKRKIDDFDVRGDDAPGPSEKFLKCV